MVSNLQKYDFADIIEDPEKKLILIIYDIIDNKRRTGMVKLLEAYGSRVQKSAFEALLSNNKYKELLKKIPSVITADDNVRIYRLNSSNEVILLGNTETMYEESVIII